MSHQSRFDAQYWMLGAGTLGRPRGMVWGGRREEDSGWGTHVYLWQIHFDIWQNQYNIVKLNKIKLKRINKYKERGGKEKSNSHFKMIPNSAQPVYYKKYFDTVIFNEIGVFFNMAFNTVHNNVSPVESNYNRTCYLQIS